MRPCWPGPYGRFSMYLAALGVSASPKERDSLVFDLVLDVFDKITFRYACIEPSRWPKQPRNTSTSSSSIARAILENLLDPGISLRKTFFRVYLNWLVVIDQLVIGVTLINDLAIEVVRVKIAAASG